MTKKLLESHLDENPRGLEVSTVDVHLNQLLLFECYYEHKLLQVMTFQIIEKH